MQISGHGVRMLTNMSRSISARSSSERSRSGWTRGRLQRNRRASTTLICALVDNVECFFFLSYFLNLIFYIAYIACNIKIHFSSWYRIDEIQKKIGSDVLRPPEQGRSGPGPGPTPRARASSPWPWPLISGAGPPIVGLAPRTFRVGPGRPQGRGPPALPVDSLGVNPLFHFPLTSSRSMLNIIQDKAETSWASEGYSGSSSLRSFSSKRAFVLLKLFSSAFEEMWACYRDQAKILTFSIMLK